MRRLYEEAYQPTQRQKAVETVSVEMLLGFQLARSLLEGHLDVLVTYAIALEMSTRRAYYGPVDLRCARGRALAI
jgi:hypothetical protein